MEENNQNNLLDNTQGPNVTIGNFDGTINTNQETQPASDENNIQEPKKKNKTLIIVLIIVLVALVGIGGYFAYDKFFAHKENPNNMENEDIIDEQNLNNNQEPVEDEENTVEEEKQELEEQPIVEDDVRYFFNSGDKPNYYGKLDTEKIFSNPTAICAMHDSNIYGKYKSNITDCIDYDPDEDYDIDYPIYPSIFYLEDGKVFYANLGEKEVYQVGKNIKDNITEFLVWSPLIGMESYTSDFYVIMRSDKNVVYYHEDGYQSAKKIINSEGTTKIELVYNDGEEENYSNSHFKFTKADGKAYYFNRFAGNTLDLSETYEQTRTKLYNDEDE